MAPPPFWICCNRCFVRFNKDTTMFFLNCKHLACKRCMCSHSDKGKKCPVCSVANIKYSDLTKLSDAQKKYFQPQPAKHLAQPMEWIKFQDEQMQRSVEHRISMKQKFKKSEQKVAEIKQEYVRAKKLLIKTVEKRRMMQAKLRKLWKGKMNSDPAQAYRDPLNSFSTSGAESRPGTSKASTTAKSLLIQSDAQSSKMSETGFFDKDAPMFQNQSNPSASFQRSTQQKTTQQKRKQPFIV